MVNSKGTAMGNNRSLKYIIPAILLAAVLSGCGIGTEEAEKPEESILDQQVFAPVVYESGEGKVRISEVMSKNNGTIRDADGDFSDWIEIENLTDSDINLLGWAISDNEAEPGWSFPDFTLYSRSRAIIFASKKNRADTELHADFSISEGETVTLRDRNGTIISSVLIEDDRADVSLAADEGGSYSQCYYPTPGRENTGTAYDSLQDSSVAEGPIIINEVAVYNTEFFHSESLGYSDWVEIKNIGSETVDLSKYYMSDKEKNLKQYRLPAVDLAPGQIIVILCDKDGEDYRGDFPMAEFSLDDESERLYISDESGKIIDYVALRNIPYGASFGRIDGRNGFFYFDAPTPQKNNGNGYRRVSSMPEAAEKDGVFDNTGSIRVELSAEGDIYYTTDGSLPTRYSEKYTSPIEIIESTVIRAVAVEDGQLESRALTLNYILNQGHELPVVSLVADSLNDFEYMYLNKEKGTEVPGNISYYNGDDSFSINCGIKMHGFSTLELSKKNMSVRFRGAYGSSKLEHDIFGGGVTEFSDLLLRGGGDQTYSIVRNEACMNIGMEFSDAIIGQRNMYCVLYVNGEYRGIYALMEKTNERLYAEVAGVSEGSVTMNEATVNPGQAMYDEIIQFIIEDDMSDPANYRKVCDAIDIDSLIDWTVFEGWTGNNDLTSGNLRFVKSTENDGKWRLMLYDLDAAFYSSTNCMVNVLDFWNQITMMNSSLVKNAEYRDKLIRRTAEALSTTLTEENISAEYTRLCSIIEPEVARDSYVSGLSYDDWEKHVETQQELFLKSGWNSDCISNLCYILRIDDEEREFYFGER